MTTSFDLISQKRFPEAYELATTEIDSSISNSQKRICLLHRGISALLMKQYDKAINDYLAVIELMEDRYSSDSEYLYAAITFWLMGEYERAIELCKVGLNAPRYTLPRYSSNFAKAPAFLYYAALKLQDKKLEALALKIMKKNKTRMNSPISQFLLRISTRQEFMDNVETNSPMFPRKKCVVEFYLAVDCLRNNDNQGFVLHLKACKEAEGRFLESEYYLAVGELDNLST